MIKQLKQSLIDYSNSLTIYDYVAFGWLFFLLFALLALSITLSKKRPRCAIILIILTLILIFTAPVAIKLFLDKTVRKVVILDQNHTELNFSKSLIVTGMVQNLGKVEFHKCYINTKIVKLSQNKYMNLLNSLKPIRKKSIIVQRDIAYGESKEFKVVFEKFRYPKEYNVTISAECY